MFKFLFKISLVGILFFGLTTACTEDGTLGGGGTPIPVEEEPLGPSIGLVTDAGLVSTNSTIPINSSFTVRVSAQAGEAALNTFTVLENGSPIAFDRIQVSDSDVGANPVLLLNETWKTGFTWDISIAGASEAVNTSYSFEVKDENDKVDVVFVNVTTEAEIVGPSAAAIAEGNYISSSAVFPSGVPFEVLLAAQSGSTPIQSVTILEDGLPIDDLTRIQANGQQFPANPWIFSEGQAALDWVVSIRNAESGDHLYEIIVADANGETSIVPIEIFGQATGTNITNSLTGKLLFNQAGPAGTGGINLFTGESVGSTDASAHLRDEGIDLSVGASVNWNQQISGANNSVIRLVSAISQPEGFSFGGIQFQEEIQDLFATGQELTLTNDAGRAITPFVIVGDIFAVQNGADFFLVEVTNIVVSDDTNDDYYELSIKY